MAGLEKELQEKETERLFALQATRDERKKTLKLQEQNVTLLRERDDALQLLDWLDYVRRRQRFLGFQESELTWLYDIPVWVVGAQNAGFIISIGRLIVTLNS